MRIDDVIRSLGKTRDGPTPAEALSRYRKSVLEIPATTFGRRFGFKQKLKAIDGSLLGNAHHFPQNFLLEWMGDLVALVDRMGLGLDDFVARAFALRFAEYRTVLSEYFPEENALEWVAARGLEVFDRAEQRGGENMAEARRVWQEVVDRERSKLTSG